jgi:hypothetical protein
MFGEVRKMTYEPDKFVERKSARSGERVDAVVVDIKSGKLSDFISIDTLKTWKNADPNAAAIEIIAETKDGLKRKRTVPTPKDNSIHPKSNLAAWRKIYGDYPKVNQKIFLVADVDGWFQFAL